jgi:cardiolipin synthase A/B
MSSFDFRWLPSGRSGLAAIASAIDGAQRNIQLQTYIFHNDATGLQIRSALERAAHRGVRVRLLVDAFGSLSLSSDHFRDLSNAGGQVRFFNPLHPRRLVYRNHRKILIADRRLAIVGGFNIGREYDGDGIESGWCDLGLKIHGSTVAGELAGAFDRMFVLADDRPRRFARLRRAQERRRIRMDGMELLLSGPGVGRNPLKSALLRDLSKTGPIRICTPYFLPTWGLRRRLMKRARQGDQVQLLLPGKSDVKMAQYAGQSLYRRLMRAGVEVLEYQPQILHAKLFLANDAVYVGSANFNTRSLHIDYELMLRIEVPELVKQAVGLFDALAEHAHRIEPDHWRRQQGLWRGFKQRLSYYVMARLDPLVARWLWRDEG